MLGEEIAELAAKEFSAGEHTLEYDHGARANGIYFYVINANGFSASRKMIIQQAE